jgi:hypothetical protein
MGNECLLKMALKYDFPRIVFFNSQSHAAFQGWYVTTNLLIDKEYRQV